MKRVPELRFKEFDGEWEEKRYSEIFKINQGLQIPISERFTDYKEGRYFYITNEFLKKNSQLSYYIENLPKIVICEEEAPYTEGVLFHNGFELTCTEPGCTYDGEWNFECNGIEYTVFVEVEN